MRRSGRTTRIIDQLVQDYFKTGAFRARDHLWVLEDNGKLKRSADIFNMVARRLANEHNIRIHIKDAQVRENVYLYVNTHDLEKMP